MTRLALVPTQPLEMLGHEAEHSPPLELRMMVAMAQCLTEQVLFFKLSFLRWGETSSLGMSAINWHMMNMKQSME
jgi:hypothetical protein